MTDTLNILVVGSGAREHALATKISESPRCATLHVTPGNAGTPGTRHHVAATDIEGIVSLCHTNHISLVVVGPEAPLAAGLVDALLASGISAFGPSQALARLESDKSYARAIAHTLNLPGPRYAAFAQGETAAALEWWKNFGANIVVKQTGLAGGKGVVVPNSAQETTEAIREAITVGDVVLEERLVGTECSLIAMSDGKTSVAFPLAQDHKRIGEGDTGLNTGGMGAYAPAPVQFSAKELHNMFITPVIDHFAAAGTPFIGVLFAGIMLTADGPRLLEYNCRFGDPEAQVLLSLLDSDLVELLLACVNTTLTPGHLNIRAGSALGVVLASHNYPQSPRTGDIISPLPSTNPMCAVFHGGTELQNGNLVTAGGRVLTKEFDHPVLVGSTDGVGTKVELAARTGRIRGTGHDIVNHCINDVLVQRAYPLFFLDYLASSKIDAEMVAEVVGGMADACAAADCVLLGGETAEMPGVYAPGAFDIAGTLVGVAERDQLLPLNTIAAGDVLIGVASNGPHTNGYSYLRKLFAWIPMESQPVPLDRPLVEALLEPHRNYLPVLRQALDSERVKALVHITGGGLPDNMPRVLPPGVGANIALGSWPMPPLFQLVQQLSSLDTDELYRTLNMGIGMVIITDPAHADQVRALIDEETWIIGNLTSDHQSVRLQ